ncbi:hypothetical protein [Moraxella bovoculi]|nr:hypothetical protein [Moraxella bovoculi]
MSITCSDNEQSRGFIGECVKIRLVGVILVLSPNLSGWLCTDLAKTGLA